MNPKIQKTLPIILSVAGSIGVVVTSILVAKDTEKAKEKINEAKKSGNKFEIIKAFFKGYYPSIIAGTATVASIAASTIISKKTEASLTATAILLDTGFRKYKYKVKELFGDKAEDISKSISDEYFNKNKKELPKSDTEDGYRLYYEEHIGFFKAKPDDMWKSLVYMNERIIVTKGWSSLKQFLNKANAIVIKDEKIVDKISYDYGWSLEYFDSSTTYTVANDEHYVEGINTTAFLHMDITPNKNDDGTINYYTISFNKEPIYGINAEYIAKSQMGSEDDIIKMEEEWSERTIMFNDLKEEQKIIKKGQLKKYDK